MKVLILHAKIWVIIMQIYGLNGRLTKSKIYSQKTLILHFYTCVKV